MSTLVARHALHTFSMSAAQRGPRRLSVRLQGKDDAPSLLNGVHLDGRHHTNANSVSGGSSRDPGPAAKKRKMEYDEEDDGFIFTRAKKRKPRASTSKTTITNGIPAAAEAATPQKIPLREVNEDAQPVKKRRNKMSFSTPCRKTEEPVRRSKRLSAEDEEFRAASKPAKWSNEHEAKNNILPRDESLHTEQAKDTNRPHKHDRPAAPTASAIETQTDDHSATKISLPFADTPVIRRNKAMREGKSGKGERRSSLGLRGRRASSLIETGNSNALPHQEVEAFDFYKHIESESLPEPKRMRQLLTWCATRALGEKSAGGEFEDQSARMAARVIQEELLKDLANRSEMSDWFSREDTATAAKPLQMRPNPKNEQNIAKIKELEEQIESLRAQRGTLESLNEPPSVPGTEDIESDLSMIASQPSLLSPEDAALLDSVKDASSMTTTIQNRLNRISASIGLVMDSFADSIHKIAQYRDAADNVAGRALAICAENLAEKENRGRSNGARNAQPSPGTQLGNVLRSLSRIER